MYKCSLRYFVWRSTLLYEDAAEADEAEEVVEAVEGEREGTPEDLDPVEEAKDVVWWW